MNRTEINLLDKIVGNRQPDDPFPLEFLLENKGKKLIRNNHVRALKSKISLKFPLSALEKEKVREKPTIKQSILDDFEKVYALNCDQERQRKRMRNVSMDSPFEPRNKPPDQHLRPDNILEKPTRLNVQSMEKNQKPLAGRLTEIG